MLRPTSQRDPMRLVLAFFFFLPFIASSYAVAGRSGTPLAIAPMSCSPDPLQVFEPDTLYYHSLLEQNRQMTKKAIIFGWSTLGSFFLVGVGGLGSPILFCFAILHYFKVLKSRKVLLSELSMEDNDEIRVKYVRELLEQKRKMVWFWVSIGIYLAIIGLFSWLIIMAL